MSNPISEAQRALLDLTVSSGSTEHPFTKALSRVLADDHEKADVMHLAETVRKEPHWLERNVAICALIGADLEDLVPPVKAVESPELLKGIVAELKSKLGAALKKIEAAEKDAEKTAEKIDGLTGKLAAALKDNEALRTFLEKATKPEEKPAK